MGMILKEILLLYQFIFIFPPDRETEQRIEEMEEILQLGRAEERMSIGTIGKNLEKFRFPK